GAFPRSPISSSFPTRQAAELGLPPQDLLLATHQRVDSVAARSLRSIDGPLNFRALPLQVLLFEVLEELLDALLGRLGRLLQRDSGEKRLIFLRKVCDLALKINRFRHFRSPPEDGRNPP